MDYDYDLASGNVNSFSYQAGKADQFHHKYEYDADNRLKTVYTSSDGLLCYREARQFYYAHGPLARIELGEGIVSNDYRYTMQGWIKGVNLVGSDDTALEAGEDGYATTGNANRWMARDEMAYTLGYNNNDYRPIGTVDAGAGGTAWTDMDNTIRN